MLKLIDYNTEKISLLYTDCDPTLNKSRVHSIILETNDDECSNPIEVFNLDRDLSLFLLSGRVHTLEYYNLKLKQINKFTLKINITGTYNIESSSIGSNIVLGNQILADFKLTNKITIGSKTYTIDKTKSSQSRLFLTEPLISTSSTYRIAIEEKVSLFPLNELRIIGIDHIVNINKTCCSDNLDKGIDFVSKFMALEQAIKCNNIERAETLYKYLNEWN